MKTVLNILTLALLTLTFGCDSEQNGLRELIKNSTTDIELKSLIGTWILEPQYSESTVVGDTLQLWMMTPEEARIKEAEINQLVVEHNNNLKVSTGKNQPFGLRQTVCCLDTILFNGMHIKKQQKNAKEVSLSMVQKNRSDLSLWGQSLDGTGSGNTLYYIPQEDCFITQGKDGKIRFNRKK